MATWQPNPNSTDRWQCDELVTERGEHIARLEDFGHAAYPTAFNAATGTWERGGAYSDRVEAMLWAERIAGLHPRKAGDERPLRPLRPWRRAG
jgi:hypothetical protein